MNVHDSFLPHPYAPSFYQISIPTKKPPFPPKLERPPDHLAIGDPPETWNAGLPRGGAFGFGSRPTSGARDSAVVLRWFPNRYFHKSDQMQD